MSITTDLKIDRFKLIPVLPKIAKLIKFFTAAIEDGELSLAEGQYLVTECILPICNQIKLNLPSYLIDVFPELLVKLHRASVLLLEQEVDKELE